MNSPDWLKYIGDRNVRTIQDAENYLENGSMKSYTDHNFGFYLLIQKNSLLPIGTCGLVKRDDLEHIDLGFAFLPEYYQKGFGFESSTAIMEHAKDDLGLDQLAAISTPENTASIALLLKLGFQFENNILFGDDKELLNLYFVKI